jgi:hypothetical protein
MRSAGDIIFSISWSEELKLPNRAVDWSSTSRLGDYPLRRTITLHSMGAFHMLQLRSYKYLDQISVTSKTLKTLAT